MPGRTGKHTIGSLSVQILASTEQLQKQMKGLGKKLQKPMQRAGRIAGKAFRAAFLAASAVGAIAVREFMKFDDAMTASLAIMGDVSASLRKDMELTARAISRVSKTSADQLAESYFFLASAGLNAKQSIASLATVEKFAVAGRFDMATATDLATDAQSALGLASGNTETHLKNLNRVTDVLVKANTLANASVQQFATSLTNRGATAMRNLNIEVEEGVAVLAAWADQGVKGERAGQGLEIVTRDLARLWRSSKEELRALNIEVFDSETGAFRLAGAIQGLEENFGSMTAEQRNAELALLGFQDRSVSYINSLIGMSDQINRYNRELQRAGGITDEVSRKQLQSFSAQMQILGNRLRDTALSLGEKLVPVIRLFTDEVVDAETGVVDSTKAIKDMQGAMDNIRDAFLTAIVLTRQWAIGLQFIVRTGTGAMLVMLAAAQAAKKPWLLLKKEGTASINALLKHAEETQKWMESQQVNFDGWTIDVDALLGETKDALGKLRYHVDNFNRDPNVIIHLKTEGRGAADILADARLGMEMLTELMEDGAVSSKEFLATQKHLNEIISRFSKITLDIPVETLGERFSRMADKIKKVGSEFNDVRKFARDFGTAFEDALVNAAAQGKTAFKDLGRFIMAELQRILLRTLLLKPLFDSIGGALSGKSGILGAIGSGFLSAFGGATPKAAGGPVTGGNPFLVGEKGPELFVPNRSGDIVPNHKLGGGSGISVTINQNFALGVQATVRAEMMSMAPAMVEQTKAAVADAMHRSPSYRQQFA